MQFFRAMMEIELVTGTELNNLCWVTEISPRQVECVVIMGPARQKMLL